MELDHPPKVLIWGLMTQAAYGRLSLRVSLAKPFIMAKTILDHFWRKTLAVLFWIRESKKAGLRQPTNFSLGAVVNPRFALKRNLIKVRVHLSVRLPACGYSH